MSRAEAGEAQVKGSAFAEVELCGRWALSLLTEGWTEEECARLQHGDEEVKGALKDALITRILAKPDDINVLAFELHIAPPALAADTEPEERSCPFCGEKAVAELEGESGWYCEECTHEWEKWPVADPEEERG